MSVGSLWPRTGIDPLECAGLDSALADGLVGHFVGFDKFPATWSMGHDWARDRGFAAVPVMCGGDVVPDGACTGQ